MNIARVKFKPWGDTYDYLNDLDLNVGDKVVVETSRGLDIAEVAELAESSDFAFRWVVQKIDDYSYKTKKKNRKEQEWKKINREVGELKIGDIVFSSKHGRLFRLEKLDGENSIFIDIENPYGKTEFKPDELGTIYLTYPIEHRVSIHIDWNDVKVGKEDNVNS